MAKKQIEQALQNYVNKGYTLCPDTSFLMNASDVLAAYKRERIVISKQVYNELDEMKNAPQGAGHNELRWAKEAQDALMLLDDIRATIVEESPSDVFVRYDLTNNRDEKIVADYVHYRDQYEGKVIFLTLDADLQAIAQNTPLDVADVNIKKFHRKRKQELQIYTTDEIVQGKKVNPIHRFFRRAYILIRNINEMGKKIVYTVGGIIIILAVIAGLFK